MRKKKCYVGSMILKGLVYLATLLAAGTLVLLLFYVFIKGVPQLKGSLFAWKYTSENASMMPAIINTLILIAVTLVIAVPIGIFSAVYLVEYSGKHVKLVAVIRLMAETLAGIPSIVYGLFGYLTFVLAAGFHLSILSGALTVSMMVLPTILRTTEEALKSVPDMYREASYGLGAGKCATIFRVILPTASSGIISGVLLAVGRIVGETAALIYTMGTASEAATSLMKNGRSLAVHLYQLMNEGLYTNEAYATAVILVLFVLIINAAADVLEAKMQKRKGIQ